MDKDTDNKLNDSLRPPAWKIIACTPSFLELGLLYLWAGIYIVLGTDATLHQSLAEPCSLIFEVSLFWVYFPIFILSLCVLRICFLLVFKLKSQFIERKSIWIQLAVLGMFIFIMTETSLALKVRVRISEEELRKHIESINYSQPESLLTSHSVGLFTVHNTFKDGKVVWLQTVLYGPPCFGGLVYCESGVPPIRGESQYEHLYGPWWRWLQDM